MLPFLRDFDASSNNLGGTLPAWVSDVDFSMYLVDNHFLCPYPPLPDYVQVDQDCVSGTWYQGVFFTLVCCEEFIFFLLSSVSVTVSAVYGFRPALVTMMVQESYKDLDVDKLHRWSRYLGKAKICVLAACILETFVAFVRSSSCSVHVGCETHRGSSCWV